jgi:hypothetical protein
MSGASSGAARADRCRTATRQSAHRARPEFAAAVVRRGVKSMTYRYFLSFSRKCLRNLATFGATTYWQ